MLVVVGSSWVCPADSGGGIRTRPAPAKAVRAASPVDDFGFVDLVALVVGCRQARGRADRAVHVDHAAAKDDRWLFIACLALLNARYYSTQEVTRMEAYQTDLYDTP